MNKIDYELRKSAHHFWHCIKTIPIGYGNAHLKSFHVNFAEPEIHNQFFVYVFHYDPNIGHMMISKKCSDCSDFWHVYTKGDLFTYLGDLDVADKQRFTAFFNDFLPYEKAYENIENRFLNVRIPQTVHGGTIFSKITCQYRDYKIIPEMWHLPYLIGISSNNIRERVKILEIKDDGYVKTAW